MKKENKLTIEYQCEEPNEEFEKGLEIYLSQYGWEWEGSGYDFHTKIRDISFYERTKQTQKKGIK